MTSLSSYGFVFGSADSIGTSERVWGLFSSTHVRVSFVRGTAAGPNVASVTFDDREFSFQRRISTWTYRLSLRGRTEHSSASCMVRAANKGICVAFSPGKREFKHLYLYLFIISLSLVASKRAGVQKSPHYRSRTLLDGLHNRKKITRGNNLHRNFSRFSQIQHKS